MLIELVRQSLSSSERQSVVGLITSEVHNRDVVELMIKQGTQSASDFLWQQQLRFYYDEAQSE